MRSGSAPGRTLGCCGGAAARDRTSATKPVNGNAALESFLSLLPKKVLDTDAGRPARNSASRSSPGWKPGTTGDDAKPALGKLTPVELEMTYTTADAAGRGWSRA